MFEPVIMTAQGPEVVDRARTTPGVVNGVVQVDV